MLKITAFTLFLLYLSSLVTCNRTTSHSSTKKHKVQPFIINGEDAKEGQYNYMVAITTGSLSDELFCGGSVLTQLHILTAAHCLTGFSEDPDLLTVYAGVTFRKNGRRPNEQSREVKKVIIHPEYYHSAIPFTIKNDIGVAVLSKRLVFNAFVQPVYIPVKNSKSYAGQTSIAVGWGFHTRNTEHQPDNLQSVQLRVITNSECGRLYAPQPVGDTEICALGYYKGICSGDSGGPLIVDSNNRRVQIGLVSWSKGCAANYPDVFTRVSSYYHFLSETVYSNS